MVRSNLCLLLAAAQNGAVTSRPLAAPDTGAGASAVQVPALRPWRRLLWTWVAFWLLLFVLSAQEYLWSGGRELWRPFVDLGTAALVATALAIVQIRRSPRFDHLLAQPARWFLHMWAWLPLQLVAFIGAMYLLRLALYSLAGERFAPGWRLEVLAYEAFKFFLYYALLGGIQFGMRSYRAWATERLRTEQQARLAQQAQLAQLTQQLQPHFLFNALNTVSSLIHSDPDLADSLLTRLATLLRAATDASQRPEQPLVKELALLHAYADIMTQRFADRVAIRWDVDVGAEHCSVPTLGLQPLIENCFRHVVERHRQLTHVVVRAACSAGTLRIEVENDGELHALPTAYGVGLGNLERRLQSLYGARATLSLHLRPGGGLIARVELPCAH
jgi:Histidine kinase